LLTQPAVPLSARSTEHVTPSAFGKLGYAVLLVSIGAASSYYLSDTETKITASEPVTQLSDDGHGESSSLSPEEPEKIIQSSGPQLQASSKQLPSSAVSTKQTKQQNSTPPVNLVAQSKIEFERANNYYAGSNGLRRDIRKAEYWYQKAAEKGHWAAARRLATIRGNKVPQNTRPAAPNVFQAQLSEAKKGDRDAQYQVAWAFKNGKGVGVDLAQANHWFLQAAQRGHTAAQFQIAYAYAEGTGIRRDIRKAIRWYQHAAADGSIAAMNNLGVIYNNGALGQSNYDEAFRWYSKAARHGEAFAQGNLGRIYSVGRGSVDKDLVEAFAWYSVAAYNGRDKFGSEMAALLRRMDDNERAEAKNRSRIYINRYKR